MLNKYAEVDNIESRTYGSLLKLKEIYIASLSKTEDGDEYIDPKYPHQKLKFE